jgi:hypothetical protein
MRHSPKGCPLSAVCGGRMLVAATHSGAVYGHSVEKRFSLATICNSSMNRVAHTYMRLIIRAKLRSCSGWIAAVLANAAAMVVLL